MSKFLRNFLKQNPKTNKIYAKFSNFSKKIRTKKREFKKDLKNRLKYGKTHKIYAKCSKFSRKFQAKKREIFAKFRLDKFKIYFALFSLLPINSRKVVFGFSFMEHNLEDILWLCKAKNFKTRGVLSADFEYKNFFKNLYHLATAKFVLIDTHFPYFYRLKMRPKTCVIQVWHAAGIFKKFGLLAEQVGFESLWYKNCVRECGEYDYCVVSGHKAVFGYCDAFNLKRSQILPFGNTKIDALIRTKIPQNEAKKVLKISPSKKLILYAPTFRNANFQDNFSLNFDFDKFFAKFGEKYELALRLHPNLRHFAVQNLPLNVHNFSLENEALILSAADALIADYSSIIFSFSHFEKPMIFYAYDLELYKKERDFYIDYENFVPGVIAKDFDALLKALENLPDKSEKSKRFWDEYMDFCDGNTAQKIVEFMEKML